MKKLLLAAIFGLLATGLLEAACGKRWCGPRRANRCKTECEPTPPICCKTIMVDQTIQVPKVIRVPARRIVTKRPDIVEEVCQPDVMVRIPQPPIPQEDRCEWRKQPSKFVTHKQPDCVTFECPPECD